MSLNPPRSMASLIVLALTIAAFSASCGGSEQRSPAAPSVVSPSAFSGTGSSARVSTRAEADADDGVEAPDEEMPVAEEPAPEPTPGPAPEPGPEPGPAPGPTPQPSPTPGPGPTPAPSPIPAPNPALDPGPFPAPQPAPGVPTAAIFWTPSNHKRMQLKVDPEPVPFSGVPVPLLSCTGLPHTWYYQQVIHGLTGIPFRLTERENWFDGRLVSRTQENIFVVGNDTARINSRWCSAYGIAHTAQHRFKGKDYYGNDIVVNGPVIRLERNPNFTPAPTPRAVDLLRSHGSIVVWGD
jgi:hypothetical protein